MNKDDFGFLIYKPHIELQRLKRRDIIEPDFAQNSPQEKLPDGLEMEENNIQLANPPVKLNKDGSVPMWC